MFAEMKKLTYIIEVQNLAINTILTYRYTQIHGILKY